MNYNQCEHTVRDKSKFELTFLNTFQVKIFFFLFLEAYFGEIYINY